jgi:cobalt-zinc-cadmium efflux system protein
MGSHAHHSHAGVADGRSAHARRRAPGRERRLGVVLALAAVYMVAELAGGLWTGSLALLADAGHMLADVAALALSLFAFWLARRPAHPGRTYGHHRAEILAALANGSALVAVAIGIAIEAVQRLRAPAPVDAGPMLAIAAGGLAVNAVGLFLLREGREASLNLRGAWLHLLSDALGSASAIAAGLLILAFGWLAADPVASLAISVLVVRSAWSLLRESVAVLMEGAPGHIDVDRVRQAIGAVSGVRSVHDLHVWTITSGRVALSAHVCADESEPAARLLRAVQARLRDEFGITHTTVQVEPQDFEEAEEIC